MKDKREQYIDSLGVQHCHRNTVYIEEIYYFSSVSAPPHLNFFSVSLPPLSQELVALLVRRGMQVCQGLVILVPLVSLVSLGYQCQV